jgi:hypothetical protein
VRGDVEWALVSCLGLQVGNLDYDEEHATVTGRKIKMIMTALEGVEQFEDLDTNLQIKAYLQVSEQWTPDLPVPLG